MVEGSSCRQGPGGPRRLAVTLLGSQIRDAFSAAALHAGEPIAIETFDDEGADEHFALSHWRDHGYAGLKDLTPCLSFFTPNAFCFFLPAYLLAALDEPESWFAGDVASRLVPPKNDPSRQSYAAWWTRLTRDQRAVVVSFLNLMQSTHGAVPEADIARLEAHHLA